MELISKATHRFSSTISALASVISRMSFDSNIYPNWKANIASEQKGAYNRLAKLFPTPSQVDGKCKPGFMSSSSPLSGSCSILNDLEKIIRLERDEEGILDLLELVKDLYVTRLDWLKKMSTFSQHEFMACHIVDVGKAHLAADNASKSNSHPTLNILILERAGKGGDGDNPELKGVPVGVHGDLKIKDPGITFKDLPLRAKTTVPQSVAQTCDEKTTMPTPIHDPSQSASHSAPSSLPAADVAQSTSRSDSCVSSSSTSTGGRAPSFLDSCLSLSSSVGPSSSSPVFVAHDRLLAGSTGSETNEDISRDVISNGVVETICSRVLDPAIEAQKLQVIQLLVLARVVHDLNPNYDVFRYQCFWFVMTLWRIIFCDILGEAWEKVGVTKLASKAFGSTIPWDWAWVSKTTENIYKQYLKEWEALQAEMAQKSKAIKNQMDRRRALEVKLEALEVELAELRLTK